MWLVYHRDAPHITSRIFALFLFFFENIFLYLKAKASLRIDFLTVLTVSAAPGIPAAAERRGAGLSAAAHPNGRLLFGRGGSSVVDSPGGDGTRRSGRARRAASTGSEDFVDPDEVARSERQAASRGNQEWRAAQRARGQARREVAAANRHDDRN